MKKLLSILLMGLLVFTFSIQTTQASDFAPVDITVTSHFDFLNETTNTVNGNGYGATLKLDNKLGSLPDYSFSYWAINDVLQPSLSSDCDFDVTSNMTIDAYYSRSSWNLAIFVDSNGNVLQFEQVPDHGIATDPVIPLPDKPGMTISATKWDHDLADITEDTIFVLQYENDASHVVPELNVIASSETDAIIGGSGSYLFNEVITVTAPATATTTDLIPEPVNFDYWEDADTGQIISYQNSYDFSVFSNRTIEAVYSAVGTTPTEIVAITDVIELRENYYTVIGQFDYKDTSDVIEWGIITLDEFSDFDLQTDDVTLYQSYKSNPETNEFVLSIPTADIAARAYLTVRLSDNTLFTTYSPVYNLGTVTFLDMEYSKVSGYTTDTVDVNGQDWEFNNVGLYTEYSVSGKSARVKGFIESQFTFLGGIEYIDFYARQYSNDTGTTLQVEYALASAPETWIIVQEDGVDLTINLTATITQFKVDLNIQEECYVRIVETAGDRANIDNLSIHAYPVGGYSDAVAPIITGTSNHTMSLGDSYTPLTGVTVEDNVDGTILSSTIIVTVKDSSDQLVAAPVDYSGLPDDTFTLTYTVSDAAGNIATVTTTLTIVEDIVNPIIAGTANATIEEGDAFNPLDGVTAFDDIDGVLTNDITFVVTNDTTSTIVPSPVDFTSLLQGTYTIDYSVLDNSDNEGTVTITLTVTTVVAATQDLFFSEFLEKGNEKALEIYNPTGEEISLEGYTIKLGVNGQSFATKVTFTSSDVIAPGGTFVIIYNQSTDILKAYADKISSGISFNGDDAIGLFNGENLLDIIGVENTDPGSEWTSSTGFGTNGTADATWTRNSSVTMGNDEFTSSEWTDVKDNVYTGLGSHTCDSPE